MTTPQSTKDIQAARKTATFDSAVANAVLNSGRRDVETQKRIAKLLSEDPAFDKKKTSYLSRPQQIERGLAVAKKLFEFVDKNDLDYMEYVEALFTIDEYCGLNLHEIAFTPVIQAQGSDEQQAEWLPKCYNHAVLGAYLQTELGHGSNVQQLETTSTYDPKTKEFVINSPTISSTKWWIGALGVIATHGVVQARLFLNGKDMGPHLFIVQLRSEKDHSLMKGIQAGEIGPKVHNAMGSLDNGWARFDNVRIPRSHMLSRFAQVTEEGQYVRPPHSKLSYGGMIFIRAQMISSLSWRLAKAVTISLRYLHMRRQFADPDLKPGEPGFGVERQVITYPGVYRRVLPVLAKTIVFMTAGKDMSNLYDSMSSQLSSGNTTLLAETHAVSSGLKTYVSSNVVEGIETVRRAMGGHGFLASSGVGRIYASELPSATYEGDNYILHLQVARAALKSLRGFIASPSAAQLSSSSAYLSTLHPSPKLPVSPPKYWSDIGFLAHLLDLRAALSVAHLAKMMDQNGKRFSELSWECVPVSQAVVEAFLGRRMQEAVEGKEGLLVQGAGQAEKEVFRKVILFFLLHTVEQALPSLLEFGIIAPPPSPSSLTRTSQPSSIDTLRLEIDSLAQKLLPEIVGLTDSFGFSDWELNSVVGNADGRVYERMLEKAQADEKLNVGSKANQARLFQEYIKPILERGRRLSKL
ncbi:uncharacterized protein JCM6883_002709 [Sporobolomyces salmoneus]|uniref:uncharacterized protein n=1 Tax=Sporobolomyces salmoneus TaxID=183962 RepID=UPI0031725EF1